MREETGGRVPPLERPARTRAWWLRRLAPLLVATGFGAAAIDIVSCRERSTSRAAHVDQGPDCATALQREMPDAWRICQAAYYGSGDHATGVLLARALHKRGDKPAFSEATWVAVQRLATEVRVDVRADALQILGVIARDDRRNDDVVTWLEPARLLHLKQQRAGEVARDDAVLALALTDLDRFTEALARVDEGIKQAKQDGGANIQRQCHLTAAKTLIRIGYWKAAKKELDNAEKFTRSDFEKADLNYQRASFEQEQEHHGFAGQLFEKALQPTTPPAATTWMLKTQLNLAYSLAEQGYTDRAQYFLNEATLLDTGGKRQQTRTWVEARIAYRQGELARASSLIDKYLKLGTADDSIDASGKIDVAILQARIGLASNDFAGAERAAQRGVDLAEEVRNAQTTLELRPWVLDKRRTPYELLFLALADRDRIDDAAMAFDRWQGRTVQDALARPSPSDSLDYDTVAHQVTRLGEWLPVASQAALGRAPNPGAVLQTMRAIDLLALIVADGQVWRLTASRGSLQLSRIAELDDIKGSFDEFRGDALKPALATNLGGRLVPDELFRKTTDTLYVLIDSHLRGLPVAALRHDETPLIAMRPIVHVLRLPETPCVNSARAGHATVLGAPDEHAPTARAEAEEVAKQLQVTREIGDVAIGIGAAATKNMLLAAAHDAVLHVASHAAVGADGALKLGDGSVAALEISARRVAPSLVVLPACATSASNDLELAGSLAAGFLGAGSRHVVATLRTVSDAGAHTVATRFYPAGGIADPPRALAKVQADLARTGNRDWPYFAVFGPDVCRAGTAEHP